MAIVCAIEAFVDVFTGKTIALIAFVALAIIAAVKVDARGLLVTFVQAQLAFIDIIGSHADDAVARVRCDARALKATHQIRARCVGIAIVDALHALVDVLTSDAVANKPVIAGTLESSWGVFACCVSVAYGGDNVALVEIIAEESVTGEAFIALAGVGTSQIRAGRVVIARV